MDSNGVILYDADCGFCSMSIQVATSRMVRTRMRPLMVQRADLGRWGLDRAACLELLHVVDARGRVRIGSDAVAAILQSSRLPWPIAGLVLRSPGVRRLSQWVYRIVARNRHRLPGGTPTCRLDVMDS
ncbi:DUF393 domain-containing protein [Arachnia propionica]|uniref:DUF393 domain-containing protein n=2 Tax=Arachnia propionica TaxID=1750 RepID=A0A3P1T6L3_9ACTN|nr:DUF393 domain-containing protein [Arachnia propionica]